MNIYGLKRSILQQTPTDIIPDKTSSPRMAFRFNLCLDSVFGWDYCSSLEEKYAGHNLRRAMFFFFPFLKGEKSTFEHLSKRFRVSITLSLC